MADWYRIELPLRFPAEAEKVSAFLIDLGMESFEETEHLIIAWISEEEYIFKKQSIDEWLNEYYSGSFEPIWQKVRQQNWNAEWEKNYPAVDVDHIIRIRAPFHEHDASFLHEIIIDPAMAFGTGHHETTSMMLSMMFGFDFYARSVCDVGCGSGVLGIFAAMKGAHVWALDNDPIAVTNAEHNFRLNQVEAEKVYAGTFNPNVLPPLDIILANINRNTLLELIPLFADTQSKGGTLLFSGFYEQDVPVLLKSASENGYNLSRKNAINGWSCLHLYRF